MDGTRKTVLITGSARARIGSYIARALVQDGYTAVIHYRRSEAEAESFTAELRTLGSESISVQADVGDEVQVQRMIDAVYANYGRLDALVTTASIFQATPFISVSAKELNAHFAANTLGTFLCAKAAGLRMVEQRDGGSIICIGDSAIDRPYTGYSAYFVSKGSLPTLTKTLAVEFSALNPKVRVNCIEPGPVLLPESISEQRRALIKNATLTKSVDKPESVVSAVRFLLDAEFVSGACIPVDGGRSVVSPITPYES